MWINRLGSKHLQGARIPLFSLLFLFLVLTLIFFPDLCSENAFFGDRFDPNATTTNTGAFLQKKSRKCTYKRMTGVFFVFLNKSTALIAIYLLNREKHQQTRKQTTRKHGGCPSMMNARAHTAGRGLSHLALGGRGGGGGESSETDAAITPGPPSLSCGTDPGVPDMLLQRPKSRAKQKQEKAYGYTDWLKVPAPSNPNPNFASPLLTQPLSPLAYRR